MIQFLLYYIALKVLNDVVSHRTAQFSIKYSFSVSFRAEHIHCTINTCIHMHSILQRKQYSPAFSSSVPTSALYPATQYRTVQYSTQQSTVGTATNYLWYVPLECAPVCPFISSLPIGANLTNDKPPLCRHPDQWRDSFPLTAIPCLFQSFKITAWSLKCPHCSLFHSRQKVRVKKQRESHFFITFL